tara:strand:- start:171 stop:545 length:375 start_codon:yes stop_codon:yes gene_type:complete
MAEIKFTKAQYRKEALKILELSGFSVDVLWHTDDVIKDYPWLDKEQALEILEKALSSDRVVEEINIEIQNVISSEYPEEKFDETLELSKQEIMKPNLAEMILEAKKQGLDKRYIQALQNKFDNE